MAILATKMKLTTPVIATALPLDPADRLEAQSEYAYNLTQDAYRDGFINLNDTDSIYWGNEGPFRINAQGGNDEIRMTSQSIAADDVIHAGSGDDKVYAGGGEDTIFGGTGDDRLYGEAGDDRMDGGSGNDLIEGGSGFDNLFGGSGRDYLTGGTEDDFLSGGSGDDVLIGGGHSDRLVGGTGNDELYGDQVWSTYREGASGDVLIGGAGNDTLNGGDGGDILTGGIGADTFSYKGLVELGVAGDRDTITDFSRAEGDKIDFYWLFGESRTSPLTGAAIPRAALQYTDGPSEERRSMWLGETDANGDQKVFINLNGSAFDEAMGDAVIQVHVGIGNSLAASDFIF